MTDIKKNLYYLHELTDYKVASDYSDVRGWEVIDANSRTIGVVDHFYRRSYSGREYVIWQTVL